MRHFLYSSIRIVISFFFILFGAFSLVVPWNSYLQNKVVKLTTLYPLAISLLGFTLLVIGSIYFANALIVMRSRKYHIRSGKYTAIVDEDVINTYLEKYWRDLFPKQDVSHHLVIKQNKLHLVVDLPYYTLEEQKPLVERIEKDLANIFLKILGYQSDFLLSASFKQARS